MKIPNIVCVGAHEIEVRKQEGLEEEGAKGYYLDSKQLIKLDSQLMESVESEVFMHEIFEIINTLYDLELDHWKIQILSEAIFTMIRLNKLDFNETKQYKNTKTK